VIVGASDHIGFETHLLSANLMKLNVLQMLIHMMNGHTVIGQKDKSEILSLIFSGDLHFKNKKYTHYIEWEAIFDGVLLPVIFSFSPCHLLDVNLVLLS